jgi:putative transposase
MKIRDEGCTTNAIEGLHTQLRNVLKNPGHFPNDEAATKLIYLALRTATNRGKPTADVAIQPIEDGFSRLDSRKSHSLM